MTPHPTHPSDIAPLWIADGKQIKPVNPHDPITDAENCHWFEHDAALHTYPCTLEPGEYPAEGLRFVWEWNDHTGSGVWFSSRDQFYLPVDGFEEWSNKLKDQHKVDTRRSITAINL